MKHKPEDITEEQIQLVIDELVERPVVADACDLVGISLLAFNLKLQKDEEFAELVQAALAAGSDRIEARAYKRGMGEDKSIKMVGGHPVSRINDEGETEHVMETHYSDRILGMLLKANKADKYGDKAEITHKGNTGQLVVPLIDSKEIFEQMLAEAAESAKEEMDAFEAETNMDAPTG